MSKSVFFVPGKKRAKTRLIGKSTWFKKRSKNANNNKLGAEEVEHREEEIRRSPPAVHPVLSYLWSKPLKEHLLIS